MVTSTVILVALLFSVVVYLPLVSALSNIAEYSPDVYSDLTESSCTSQGYDYFNSLTQTCESCGTGFTPDTSTNDTLGDPTGCKCALGYYQTDVDCYGSTSGTCVALTCTACASGSPAAYSDGSGCTTCDSSTQGIQADLECGCASNMYMLQEVNQTGHYMDGKQCVKCAEGKAVVSIPVTIAGLFYEPDRYSCRSCPDDLMEMTVSGTNYACTCPSGYTLTGVTSIGAQSCVLTTMIAEFSSIENSASTITYYETSSQTSVVSQVLLHYYARSAALCKYYGGQSNIRECEALANMCALSLYDSSYGACKALYAASNARSGTTNSIAGWGAGAPWMYVAGGGDACFLEEYRTPVSLFDQMMRYVVGKYTLNGTFAGYDEIGTLFTYCSRPLAFSGYGGGEGSSTGWQYYGASETQNYQCDLSTLLDKDQYFYELFLYDPKTDDTENNLLPVPVRVVGVTLDGGSTTSNTLSPELLCDGDDVLVRRFFLYDIVSGFSSTSGDTPDVIRYAQNITIEMALSETYRVISNPVLTIQFGEALPSEFPATESTNDDLEIADTGANTQVVEYTFNAIYSMDMDTFDRQLYRWGIASAVMCGLYFLFRLNNWWLRMNRGTSPDSVETGSAVTGAFESVLLCASSYVYFFFPITTLVCWYFIAFYKLQSVPAAMLPTVINEYVKGSNYYAFTTTLQSMFFLHLFYCLVLIYRQCNADVFFLDWEPAVSNKNNNGKVSVWRSIFVANEWSEMQTMRKIDPHFTLFWLVFFLIGLGQENVATMQPNVGNLAANNSPINPWLRFGNTVFWWLVLSVAQWLWKFLVYERFFSETKETWFIDFATLAKISIFCFDEPFHGYYLHCRSPYQHADGTMADLQQMLERETQGMTTDRSLDSNFPDVQAFQCFFTGEFRTAFSRIYNTMVIAGAGGNDGGAARRRGMEGAGAGAPLNADKQLRAWKELTVFLQEFVENNFKKVTLRRTIREPTLFEEVTEYPADLSRNFEEPNVFLPDRHHRYTRCMFLGREWELLIMNILAFATFDLWLSSTAYAALLTYLLDFLFCYFRKEYGQAVITNKSLIDSRFLS